MSIVLFSSNAGRQNADGAEHGKNKKKLFTSRNSLDMADKHAGERITVRFKLSNKCESTVAHAVSFYTVINGHETHNDQHGSICVRVCIYVATTAAATTTTTTASRTNYMRATDSTDRNKWRDTQCCERK